MIDLATIQSGMEVLTSDGERVGTVDRLLGHMMFLKGDGGAPAGEEAVPLAWVTAIDEAVRLAKSGEQLRQERQASTRSTL